MLMTLLPISSRRWHIFDDEIIKNDEKKKLADRFVFAHSVKYHGYCENILCESYDVGSKYQ